MNNHNKQIIHWYSIVKRWRQTIFLLDYKITSNAVGVVVGGAALRIKM